MYTIFTLYDDLASKTETAATISIALSTAAIYLEDNSCIDVKIWEKQSGNIIMDYWREG